MYRRSKMLFFVLATVIAAGACAPDSPPARTGDAAEGPSELPAGGIARLLAEGHAVFGLNEDGRSFEAGVEFGADRSMDFVFYSLESGRFDVESLKVYMSGLEEGAGEPGRRPMAVRIPPVGDSAALARERIEALLAAGTEALVVPHVQTPEQARLAVDAMGDRLWPGNPTGDLVNMLIVEDEPGMHRVREIVATEGVSVIFAGPGSLRRAYDRNMEMVEAAIQTVLSACLEFDVPCGVTAGVDDIALRLEQGFRVIIVTEYDALAVGMAAAGRADPARQVP